MLIVIDIVVITLLVLVVLITGFYGKEPGDKYAQCGVIALVSMAIWIVVFLQFQVHFSLCALGLGLLIWIHHYIVHFDSDFSEECTFLTFQFKDISNHETWIVACFVAAGVYLL
jgi:membrane protease YdiL (CAAX protease family)